MVINSASSLGLTELNDVIAQINAEIGSGTPSIEGNRSSREQLVSDLSQSGQPQVGERRLAIRNFAEGLWVAGPRDKNPEGSLRRAKGVSNSHEPHIRSRWGGQELYGSSVFAAAPHTFIRFGDVRFQGASTILYRDGTSIRTGLDGTRLYGVAAPPTPGITDSLFVSGGGSLFKVDTSGNDTNWGITTPGSGMGAADGVAGNLNGTYLYAVSFENTTTGTRSQKSVSLTATPTNDKVDLSSIPTSSDSQVGRRVIWRTIAGGASFFVVTTINDNSTTTYTDDLVDSTLSGNTAYTDFGTVPSSDFGMIAGPYRSQIFLIGRTTAGTKGRTYFTNTLQAESIDGFLNTSTDDNPGLAVIKWNDAIWVFAEDGKIVRIFEDIDGNKSLTEFFGNPPLIGQDSAVPTPFGIVYQSNDGLRRWDGSRSLPLATNAVSPIFRSQTVEGITKITSSSVVAAFGRDEYLMSDGTTSLGIRLDQDRWRNIGFGSDAITYEPDTNSFIVEFSGAVNTLDEEDRSADGSTSISFEVEPGSALLAADRDVFIKRLYIDADTSDEKLNLTLVLDNTTVSLPIVQTSSRDIVELGIGQYGRIVSVRFSGSLNKIVEIYGVEADVYVPG